jgi:hypothetical protein
MYLKASILALMLFVLGSITAQNLQVHYDLGKDRQHPTSTIEMFKPDKYGNTFFFIDMNYNVDGVKGVSLAYWEIARVFKTEKMPIGIHAEYNGGLGQFLVEDQSVGYTLNDAWLGGIDYSINAKDFSKGLSLKLLYKYIRDKHEASFQITGVWYVHFVNNKFTFCGFADFWREDWDFDFDGEVDTEFIFLTEPQIWYNINKTFSVGSEIEMSSNFANNKGFMVNPTIGVKWNIN